MHIRQPGKAQIHGTLLMTMNILVKSLADTERTGRLLAGLICRAPFSILLKGDLGSGKTTLTRAIVSGLPGGDQAEVASPSFTICNFYPTTPPVLHCDLYRLGENARLPEEAEDRLDDGCIMIAEWAEYLDRDFPLPDCLEISFDFAEKGNHSMRTLTLAASGRNAELALAELGRCSA